jgi:predicted Zn finger-like uncharacterized protein
MIIQCEKCQTKFNLDESLIKRGGSKVRCSLCKQTFIVYPPERVFAEAETRAVSQDELEETLEQDSLQAMHEGEAETGGEEGDEDFDDLFEESLEDLDEGDTVSPEDLYDLTEEDTTGTEVSLDRAYPEEPSLPKDIEHITEDESGAFTETISSVSAPLRSGKSYLLRVFLILVLVLVGATAAIILWGPDMIEDSLSILKPGEKSEIADAGLRRLSFNAVTGSFVESIEAGHLFVIRGVVRNDYPKKRSFILVKGSILDDKGQVIKEKLAYAGNSFEEEEIKKESLERINKAMKNRYGKARKNLNVASGGSLPFTIVFEDLPENLSEFTVEAVSSSPGS